MDQRKILVDLLENSSYEGVQLFLSKLEPHELFQLSKSIPLLRVYLNGTNIFKSLFEIRAKIPNPVSAIEQDMIAYFGETQFILKEKKPISIENQAKIYFYYKDAIERKFKNLKEKVDKGEITIEDADNNFSHPLMLDLKNIYGEFIEYEFKNL